MRVLIIPEDPTLDQYVLKPVVARILTDLELTARVDVLQDPHLRGVGQALNKKMVASIVRDNPMIDLFVLAVDRDCNRKKNEQLAQARCHEHADQLVAVLAHQEVEVWAMALHKDKLPVSWRDVRADCDPKERFWDPLVAQERWLPTVGKGRKKAMRALSGQWKKLLSRCPELKQFRKDVRRWQRARAAP